VRGDAICEQLDHLIRRLIATLLVTYGNATEDLKVVFSELDAYPSLPTNAAGIASRRALLLYAIHHEPEVTQHFGDDGADIRDRIMPFLEPHFLRHCAQYPDSLVRGALIMTQLFPNERLGNWPNDPFLARHAEVNGRIARAMASGGINEDEDEDEDEE